MICAYCKNAGGRGWYQIGTVYFRVCRACALFLTQHEFKNREK